MVATESNRVIAVLAFLLLLPAVLAPRGAAAVLEPVDVGWDRYFRLDWKASTRHGSPVVNGYLSNTSPYQVTQIRLLVDALSPTGEIVGQKISWVVGSDLGPFGRVYFEVAAPPDASSTYRVRVFSFDRVEIGTKR